MRAPGFWYRKPGIWSALLWPLGHLYALSTKRRLHYGSRATVGVPVICVGNINVGGTGKTPTVIDLVERLTKLGMTPHVVTRGYGGRLTGPVEVDLKIHSSDDVGDEPLIIAPFAPVWVSADREDGANSAVAAGASIVVLDDALQNPSLHHDLTLIVVDAERGFGNELVMPAGPLREPVSHGFERGDLLLSIGPDSAQRTFTPPLPDHLDHLRAELVPVETGMDWPSMKVVAFAGIGDPGKFFQTLRNLGADLVGTHALDDHQKLERTLLHRLLHEAERKGAQLVTTEKDAVRIPEDLRSAFFSLPVRLVYENPDALDDTLGKLLSSVRHQ